MPPDDEVVEVLRNWSVQDRGRHRPDPQSLAYRPHLYAIVAKGKHLVGKTSFSVSKLAAAYWPEQAVIVFRFGGADPYFTFYDVRNGETLLHSSRSLAAVDKAIGALGPDSAPAPATQPAPGGE